MGIGDFKLASEVLRNESEPGSDQLLENGRWVPKAHAAFELGVSERTIETRLKSGLLVSRLRDGKREVFLRNGQSRSESRSEEVSDQNLKTSEGVSNNSEPSSDVMLAAFGRMMELSERVLEQSKVIEKAQKEASESRSELVRMNFEREAYNGKLQKYHDTERELMHLRGELEVLRKENGLLKQENEQLQKKGLFGWFKK